jgi:ABC-type multidrug transport system ATPase subunit
LVATPSTRSEDSAGTAEFDADGHWGERPGGDTEKHKRNSAQPSDVRYYRSERQRENIACQDNHGHLPSDVRSHPTEWPRYHQPRNCRAAKLGIGYAFQQPPRFKGLKIKDLLALAAGTGLDEKTCGLLYEVGLCPSDYLEREVDASLSGGELKRIEIATLLARKLAVAIYDEPEAGIDLWSFGRLTDTFRRLHRETTATYVIISHQERLLEQADEIILMVDGMIREMGRKEEIWPQIVNDAACACGLDCAERRDTDAECYR